MQALWMVLGSLFFATMAVCVKFASAYFNAAELVFYRGLLGMLFMWLLARRQGVSLGTGYPGMHAWRSLVGVISLGAWFYAIAWLPLATAMTLNYMSSVWVAAFLIGGALMAWKPRDGTASALRQGPLVLTVLAGFAGVVLMLRPTIEQNQIFCGPDRADVGLHGRVCLHAGDGAGQAGRAREPHGVLFRGGLGRGRRRGHAGHRHLALGLATRAVARPRGAAGGGRAAVHDARLQPRRHTGGGQFAILGHCVWRGVQRAAVWRHDPAAGWAGMALIVASGIAATVLRARAAPNAPPKNIEGARMYTTLISAAQLQALRAAAHR
jgi:S-adenosylmethionine uptake transporter